MSNAATKPDTQQIEVEAVFPHAVDLIWKTITTGQMIERWINMPTRGFRPVAGTDFTFQTTPAGAWDGTIRCKVLEAIPNERLVYSWKGGDAGNVGYGAPLDTVVTWTLARAAGGTRVRLVHAGFVLPRNESAFTKMSGGWKRVIQNVDALTAKPN